MPTVVVPTLAMSDGTTVPVRLVRGDEGAPVVVVWPGLGLPATYFDKFAVAMSERGYHVATADLRGAGDSTPRPSAESTYGYREFADEDVPAVVELARQRFPGSPVYLLGHSLGGQLSALSVVRHPELDISGLIVVASQTPYFRGYPQAKGRKLLGVRKVMQSVIAVRGYWTGTRFDEFGPQAGPLMTDWVELIRSGRFRIIGADGDHEAEFAAATVPVLSVTLADDPDAPPSAAESLVGKFAGAKVTREHIDQALGHNRWARDCDIPVAVIDRWIRSTLTT